MSDLVAGNAGSLPFIPGEGINFAPAELQELQLTVLTAVDPARRLEAFRRLLLGQLDTEARQGIARRVLQDADPALQREALQVLGAFGNDTGPIQLLQATLAEDSRRVIQSFEQLARLELSNPLAEGVTAFLVRRFEQLGEEGPLVACAKTLARHRRHLHEDLVPSLVARTLLLKGEPAEAGGRILKDWADRPQRGQLLHGLLESYGPGPAGDWLLPLIARSGWRSPQLMRLAVEQLHAPTLSEPSCVAELLIEGGAVVLDDLIAAFTDSPRPAYTLFVVQKILSGGAVPSEQLERVTDFCLEIMGSERQEVLPVLLEIPFGQLNLDESRRRRWLRELLLARERVSSEHLLNTIDFRLRQMGPEALEILLEAARFGTEPRERLHALRLLTDLAPEDPLTLAQYSELIDDLQTAGDLEAGELLRLRGRLWGRTSFPAPLREAGVREALGALWRRSRTLERLEALGEALPVVSAPLATQIVLSLLELLETRLPAMEKKSLRRSSSLLDSALLEERYHVVGLVAAARVFLRQDLHADLVTRLVSYLEISWKRVGEGAISLGPDGTRHLIRALGAQARHYPQRTRETIHALIDELAFVDVQRVLAKLWDLLEGDELVLIGDWISDRLRSPRELEPEEIESLLELAKIYCERCTEEFIEKAARIIHRVQGLRRYATLETARFLTRLQVTHPVLQDLITPDPHHPL